MARISKSRQNEIRQSIIKEAKTLFFSQGFDNTSTKEISKKVGIAEGTLFNYFKDKNDLFLVVVRSEFDIDPGKISVDHHSDKTAPELIYGLLSAIYAPFLRLPKPLVIEFSLALISISKKDLPSIHQLMEIDFRYISECKALIDALKQRGHFIAETDTQELTENILSTFLFEVILYAYTAEITREELLARFKRKIESVCKGYLADA